MTLSAVIDRLTTHAPIFNGNVAGAAEFNAEAEASRLTPPMAFVMRSGGSAPETGTLGEVTQMYNEEYTIVIAIDNSADTRGHVAEQLLDQVMAEVIAALLGWTWDAYHNGMIFVRDEHIAADRARLWHQMTFSTESAISSLEHAF